MLKNVLYLCAVLTVVMPAPPSTSGSDKIEKPTYRNGDFWQFKVMDIGIPAPPNWPSDGIYAVIFRGGRFIVNPGLPPLRRVMKINFCAFRFLSAIPGDFVIRVMLVAPLPQALL